MSTQPTSTPSKPSRQDVKAILDYLLGRAINLGQAQAQIKALGLPVTTANGTAPLNNFLYGIMSYDDCFKAWGV